MDWIEAQKVKNPLHKGLALTDRPVLCTYKPCTGNQTSLGKYGLAVRPRRAQQFD